MDLYFNSPRSVYKKGFGYALSHELTDRHTIELYKTLKGLILDNGADELGEGEGGARLAWLAGRLEPNWVILPDVLHKDKKTRKKSLDFYNFMRDTGYDGKFMSVIQAKTPKKGLQSYDFWAESGIVDRIGITYDTQISTGSELSQSSWGKRLSFIIELLTSGRTQLPIHLLGTLDVKELNVLFTRYPGFIPNIASHDTTAPYACPTKFLVNKDGISFGRAKDWPKLDFNKSYTFSEWDTACFNVAAYLSACCVPKTEWNKYLANDKVDFYWDQIEKLRER